ncbi:MAG TPA: helix-turn-helix domain-containing protein [Gammaproteobacteria bacterium]|nr:helix-turn-helix domain-containing protein [Gammaproteobacteria bacterium]
MTDARQEYTSKGFGAHLKAAREARHLTQKDAASQLHLNPSMIEMLESENFEKAPSSTFLRGYLRAYARLLNFSEEEIQTALAQSGLEAPLPRTPIAPVLRGETMQMSDRYMQRISTYVIVGLFVFTGIWWGFHSSSQPHTKTTLTRSAQPAPMVTPPPHPVATTTNTPVPAATVVPQPVAPVQPVVAAQSEPKPSAAPVPAPAPAPAPTSTPARDTAPAATAPAPSNPVAVPPVANDTAPLMAVPPVANTGIPAIAPAVPPYATAPIVGSPDAVASTNTETPKKRNRHHKQDSNVSGFAMALPEPGL